MKSPRRPPAAAGGPPPPVGLRRRPAASRKPRWPRRAPAALGGPGLPPTAPDGPRRSQAPAYTQLRNSQLGSRSDLSYRAVAPTGLMTGEVVGFPKAPLHQSEGMLVNRRSLGGHSSSFVNLSSLFYAGRMSSISEVSAASGAPETDRQGGGLRPPPFRSASGAPRAAHISEIDDSRPE